MERGAESSGGGVEMMESPRDVNAPVESVNSRTKLKTMDSLVLDYRLKKGQRQVVG